jgi:LysM repeat protein
MDRLNKLKRDPRLVGFVAGFGGVLALGLIGVVAWLLWRDAPPVSPTLVPSIPSQTEKVTLVPPATEAPVAQVRASATKTESLTAAGGAAPATLEASATPGRTEALQYTVQDGDTLFDIALAHGVSVEALVLVNDLEGEIIRPGQKLNIPPDVLPTPTPYQEGENLVHTVSSGETLIGIAAHYSVTVDALLAENDLEGETIVPGQRLQVPATLTTVPPTATIPRSTISSTLSTEPWQPSILEGDLAVGYPLTRTSERFTLHYQPNTPGAQNPERVVSLVDAALAHIEKKLQVSLDETFDVYVAGSLFAPPDMALRGRSFSSALRNFYLYDGSGTPDERRYIIIHELTHLVAMNTLGRPDSVMLHEGLAVYTGIEAMAQAEFIPLAHFCAAYQQAGELPSVSGNRPYNGHTRDLDLYSAAGCFVEYLIENYGLQDFKQLFTSGEYKDLYGKPLAQLEKEWTASLEETAESLTFDPADLISSLNKVADGYDRLFASFEGAPAQMNAYRELDQARIAMLQGRFKTSQSHLEAFEAYLVSN